MRSDSPPPSWYEPPDDWEDDDEPEPLWPVEALHVLEDCIVWHCAPNDDD